MFSFFKKSADADTAPATASPPELSWRERLKAGLTRTREQWGGKLKSIFAHGRVDDELLESLETLLLTSDVGMEATQHLLDALKARAKRDGINTPEGIQQALSDALHELLLPLEEPLDISAHRPFIIMIAGVNGAGKTTSIGKLAAHSQSGHSSATSTGRTAGISHQVVRTSRRARIPNGRRLHCLARTRAKPSRLRRTSSVAPTGCQ